MKEEKITVTLTKLESECIIQSLRAAGISVNKLVMEMTDENDDNIDNAFESAEQKILNEW